MYDLYFYQDKNGKSPIRDYLRELAGKTDKNSRIKLQKIQDYTWVLREYGKAAGEPYMKHIEGEIWELRPIRGRIFFASWTENGFILLHHFEYKRTNKTPIRELNRAKQNLKEMKERSLP